MTEAEFVFEVRLSGSEDFNGVLREVAANLFRHLGCGAAAVAEFVGQLDAVVTPSLASKVGVDVQFHARAGSCEVVVSSREREIWRTTRVLGSR